MSGTKPVLATSEIRAGYQTGDVLRGVSIELNKGELVGVVGRNGIGKTTLMRAIIGLVPLRGGQVLFNGLDVSGESADARARRGIGYVPQGRGIFPQLTVHDNLRMGGFINEANDKLDFDLVYSYFPFLKERRRQRGGTLSGGQQAMLAIARALISGPELLLLDEPSDGVQPNIVQEIGEFIVELNRTRGITVLVVEQNVDLMQTVAQRAYGMDKGQVNSRLTREELLDDAVLASHLAV